ncbi:MAG: heme-binding protein, partial [Trebonia sp.]
MPTSVPSADLAEFQQLLIGTWQNVDELTQDGKPLSFNVMPLPQDAQQPGRPSESGASDYGGFILKNFAFTETIRFNGTTCQSDPPDRQDPGALAVPVSAPNRGGTYTQAANALFYEQQVRFAEGPDQGKVVHIENGAWLHLGSQAQDTGPYNQDPAPPGAQVLPQPPSMTIAKQVSVPHGNSILALGSVDVNDRGTFGTDPSGLTVNTVFEREVTIPDAQVPYPEPSNIVVPPFYNPYAATLTGTDDFENPDVKSSLNPNYPLQLALEKIKPRAFIHWRVTTEPLFGGAGVVTNIPFEQRRSDVTEYTADYWLLSKDRNASESRRFDYLLYTQVILLRILVSTNDGGVTKEYVFPHVTS